MNEKYEPSEGYGIIGATSSTNSSKYTTSRLKNFTINSNKLKDEIIAAEPGYSNVNYVMSSEIKNNLCNDNSGCEDSRNTCTDLVRLCGCFTTFLSHTRKTCLCPCCGEYNISKQDTKPSVRSPINEDRKQKKPGGAMTKCSTKLICCLVSVLILIFVAAGAILLYQSCKYCILLFIDMVKSMFS